MSASPRGQGFEADGSKKLLAKGGMTVNGQWERRDFRTLIESLFLDYTYLYMNTSSIPQIYTYLTSPDIQPVQDHTSPATLSSTSDLCEY